MRDASIEQTATRTAGVLLPVSALPGPYGIGDLGPAAHAWIDDLAEAEQTWWQILPLGPPGEGNSPYQSFSAFAGNPDLISLQALVEERLLSRSDLPREKMQPGRVHYEQVSQTKRRLLDIAWDNFRGESARTQPLHRAFDEFQAKNKNWLDDFALFMAIKESLKGAYWTRWPTPLMLRRSSAIREARDRLADKVERHAFAQFLFHRQLHALRSHARAKGVRIIGDLPMFVSAESADVWAHPNLFQLDARRRPTVVAGVPPDYFSKTGQRWGNPLYNWRAMRRENFRWWVERVRSALGQADLIRIDHFRGLAACWEIPARSRTARHGRWAPSPGAELLTTVRREIGKLPFIAEDLGLITPDVEALRDQFGLSGMRVLQFGFGGDSKNPHLPHNFVRNTVAYTGTHDNDTVVGWEHNIKHDERQRAIAYAPDFARDPAGALCRLAWSSVARIAIAPVQDLLALGSEARINVPGRPRGNWAWRLSEPLPRKVLQDLAALTRIYGRAGIRSDRDSRTAPTRRPHGPANL